MKTNVMLQSTDRELFGITIRQNTKGSFLSVSDLQQAYEKARWQYGWSDRKISDAIQTKETKERIYYLLENQGFIKTDILGFMGMVEKEGITNVLKGLGVWETKGRGENRTVMCNPYIWVLLAMEMNPMIYAKVVIWLTDSLIFDRIDAGGEYLPMNSAIKNVIQNPDYTIFAKTINERVFGQHISGIRNLASARELRKIADIEKYVKNLVEQGFVKTQDDIIKAIRTYQ